MPRTPTISDKNELTISLYHGTSTLFLDSIVKHGLGGFNPVLEWNMHELCGEVNRLSKEHLANSELYQRSSNSLQRMAEQSNTGAFNWQHGHVYLSPSEKTAVRYATNGEYGSELLSYIIMFLKELIKLKIEYVIRDLSRKHQLIFGLIEAKHLPVLIEAQNISIASLQNEHGENPGDNLQLITDALGLKEAVGQALLQQCNFRLIDKRDHTTLKFWQINVQNWNQSNATYNLIPFYTCP